MDQSQKDVSQPVKLAPDVDPVSEVVNPVMSAATTFNLSLLTSFAAYQKEWFGFLNRRWHENLDVSTRLASCRKLPEVQQVCLEYWNRTAAQYGVEFQHLGELAQAKPQSAPEPAAPGAKSSRAVTTPDRYRPAA